jgi:outer membrane protein
MIRVSWSNAMATLALMALSHPAEASDATGPLLRLDEAVSIAARGNHAIAGTALDLEITEERSAALRTRRYPALRLDAAGLRLLKSADFTVPAGAFGTYAGTGPIPSSDTSVSVPAAWTANLIATITQPLTQQYRIALQLDELGFNHQIAKEDLREAQQRIAAEVKVAYYQLSATSAGIIAIRDLVKAIEDVDGLTTRYLTEGRVLRSEALEVKARLARERQRLGAIENGFETEHEHLNQLLGRELSTPYRVAMPSELVAMISVLSLEDARGRAEANRAEIRKSELKITQAETAKKIADSQWIPDVSLFAAYALNINYQVIPTQVAVVGLSLTWDPWDWGRRSHEAHEHVAAAAQARQSLQETQEQLSVEVGQRWRAVRDAEAELEAARVSEEAASAYLVDTRNRYREDATLLKDVLEAEARLSSARHNFTDALAGYWSATAELERTTGHANS